MMPPRNSNTIKERYKGRMKGGGRRRRKSEYNKKTISMGIKSKSVKS